uniref:NUDIX hydrolase n=2 Tax=Roseivirga sp. TaxID=1964215 RepID=UPI004047540F
MDIRDFFQRAHELYLPQLSVDIVIVGYEEKELKCLLLQIGDKWLLPGGFIGRDESVDQAAVKVLKMRTGLENSHLKFLSVFGDANRQFKDQWKPFAESIGLEWPADNWFDNRFVTLAYYALVNIEKTHPQVSNLDQAYHWFSFDTLPEMWLDHKKIVLEARDRLKQDIKQESITYNLLPDQFTMPDLHQLHQVILQEELDRSRFQKKMLSLSAFERLPKIKKETPGRNPYLYRVKKG